MIGVIRSIPNSILHHFYLLKPFANFRKTFYVTCLKIVFHFNSRSLIHHQANIIFVNVSQRVDIRLNVGIYPSSVKRTITVIIRYNSHNVLGKLVWSSLAMGQISREL